MSYDEKCSKYRLTGSIKVIKMLKCVLNNINYIILFFKLLCLLLVTRKLAMRDRIPVASSAIFFYFFILFFFFQIIYKFTFY